MEGLDSNPYKKAPACSSGNKWTRTKIPRVNGGKLIIKSSFKPRVSTISKQEQTQAGQFNTRLKGKTGLKMARTYNKEIGCDIREQEGGTSKHGANIPKCEQWRSWTG